MSNDDPKWDIVGGNPCPGDVIVLRDRIRLLGTVADHGGELKEHLTGVLSGMGSMRWTGSGADGARDVVQACLPAVIDFWSAHRDAARALRTYVDGLEARQRAAEDALRDLSNALAAAAAAEAEEQEAHGRWNAANQRMWALNREIKNLHSEIVLAVGTGRSTASIDAKLHVSTSQLSVSAQARAQAEADRTVAKSKYESAATDEKRARGQIAALREEHKDGRTTASNAILGSVGIAPPSHNPLVRAYENTVKGVHDFANSDALDAFIDATQTFDDKLTVLSLIVGNVPLLKPVSVAMDLTIGAVKIVGVIGREFQRANGAATDSEVNSAYLDAAGAGAMLLVGQLKVPGKSEKAYDSVPGSVKRLLSYDDAGKAPWVLGRKGVPRPGRSLVIPPVPKVRGVSDDLAKRYIFLNLTRLVVERGKSSWDALNVGVDVGSFLGRRVVERLDIAGEPQ